MSREVNISDLECLKSLLISWGMKEQRAKIVALELYFDTMAINSDDFDDDKD